MRLRRLRIPATVQISERDKPFIVLGAGMLLMLILLITLLIVTVAK